MRYDDIGLCVHNMWFMNSTIRRAHGINESIRESSLGCLYIFRVWTLFLKLKNLRDPRVRIKSRKSWSDGRNSIVCVIQSAHNRTISLHSMKHDANEFQPSQVAQVWNERYLTSRFLLETWWHPDYPQASDAPAASSLRGGTQNAVCATPCYGTSLGHRSWTSRQELGGDLPFVCYNDDANCLGSYKSVSTISLNLDSCHPRSSSSGLVLVSTVIALPCVPKQMWIGDLNFWYDLDRWTTKICGHNSMLSSCFHSTPKFLICWSSCNWRRVSAPFNHGRGYCGFWISMCMKVLGLHSTCNCRHFFWMRKCDSMMQNLGTVTLILHFHVV